MSGWNEVPYELIGRVAVEFGRLDLELIRLAQSLNSEVDVGQMSSRSSGRILADVEALVQSPNGPPIDVWNDLSQDIGNAIARRNGIVHAYWQSAPSDTPGALAIPMRSFGRTDQDGRFVPDSEIEALRGSVRNLTFKVSQLVAEVKRANPPRPPG